ncbi:MAG: hypothetical protein B6247_07725 [Candidatus Parabeggiatoa sp. nov. 2]|nr:MAG: hypothetical protein B6247_07725 [Beggiatoa sp. 4572_84]
MVNQNPAIETTEVKINHRVTINVVHTDELAKALIMTKTTMESPFNRLGIITGAPGTGKTIASYYLATKLNGIRICCSETITKKGLLSRLAKSMDHRAKRATIDELTEWLELNIDGQLFLIDEANHLNWKTLEILRYLADECGATIVLFGTQILTEIFQNRNTKVLLAQLSSRIGAKTIVFTPIAIKKGKNNSLKKVGVYFIYPTFGDAAKNPDLIKTFHRYCEGNWRLAQELIVACQEVMRLQNQTELTQEIIHQAGSYIQEN